jgi:hypothetical protein
MRRLEALTPRLPVLVLPFALGLSACVASHRGLIELGGEGAVPSVRLCTPDGRHFTLRSTEQMELLRSLEGCTVQIAGPRAGRTLLVQEWSVIEAGDGSAPYVGYLRNHGSNLVIDDRNSGMPLVLDEASARLLGVHAGRMVMISGYVVGAQLLHVVNFRVLID